MSEKASCIPVKRKVHSQSSREEGSEQNQDSKKSEHCKTNKTKINSQDMTEQKKSTAKSNSENNSTDKIQTRENGIGDCTENSVNRQENEIIETVASIHCSSDQTALYYTVLILLSGLAVVTKLYKLEVPAWVCWDETHFGKMGSWYINHTFFFDVHPPLGKMMIGLAGYLSGYNGTFAFDKPGDEYGDTPYIGMRIMCACMGAALVPFVYMSTWLLCKSITAALIAATFVLLDLGLSTLTRYILLDPILMFFIMAATYSLLKFHTYKDRPFSFIWWFWMAVTGAFLASAISVKFVGLFVVLLAGYSTINDLWRLLGNKALSMIDLLKHFIARAACLIVLPVICYMVFFAIHFAVLYKSGNGDGFYSSQFQSKLEGNRLHNISMPEKVAYGSVIALKQQVTSGSYLHSHPAVYPTEPAGQQQGLSTTVVIWSLYLKKSSSSIAYGSVFSIKQQRTGGTYLHSHPHLYPEEKPPRQQQVTGYSHKDENNMWRIKQSHYEPLDRSYPVFVRNGDLVRLEHVMTRRNLHSHKEPAPVTSRHFQVTGYGQDGHGDANDIWQIVVPGEEDGAQIKVVKSKFKLIHYYVKCALSSTHDKKLPKWGFEQQEVTCNPNTKDKRTLWSIEEVRDQRLPNVSFDVYTPTFLDMFIESHAVMTQGNAGLKPKEGEVTSRPWQWPINLRGQVFSGKDHRVYLLGNPVIWYGLLVIQALFLLIFLVHSIQLQRGVKMSKEIREFKDHTFNACWWAMIGWALHYFPFWPMTRVLYFHHYFPALLYICMLGGIVLDYMIKMLCHSLPRALSMVVFHTCLGVILSGTAYSFYLFHPLTYGMTGPTAIDPGSQMYGLKWLDTWEI